MTGRIATLLAACAVAACSQRGPDEADLRAMTKAERAAALQQRSDAEQSVKDLHERVLEDRVARLEQDVAVLTARLDHTPGLDDLTAVAAPPIDVASAGKAAGAATLPLVPPPAPQAPDDSVPPPAQTSQAPRVAGPKPKPRRNAQQPRLTYDIGG